ncbi:MAG: TolC family protein [Pirellulales bacterium]
MGRLAGQPEALPVPAVRSPGLELPVYGTLSLPSAQDEGPPDGLTLDGALELMVRQNPDLQSKYQELPKAAADVLSAGLLGNPLLFGSVDNAPYGSYSPQRPGEVGYSLTVIQPFDVNHKRRVRVLAAQRAQNVLEAQYQDAVRTAADAVYSAYVDVLAARDTVRYLETSLNGLNRMAEATSKQVEFEQEANIVLDRVLLQRDTTQIALEEALVSARQARQSLAALLGAPNDPEVLLDVRGSLQRTTTPVPPLDELIGLANASRPDLVAYRLGVNRAQADVQLQRKEGFPDVFVLYTPWALTDNSAIGGQNATAWSLGALASVPIFNRNQGNVRRAEATVVQSRIELAAVDRRVEFEVRQAYQDYEVSQAAARRLEETMLPRAQNVLSLSQLSRERGQIGILELLAAEREYSEVVRRYRDSLIRARRAELRLNTAAAMRIIR